MGQFANLEALACAWREKVFDAEQATRQKIYSSSVKGSVSAEAILRRLQIIEILFRKQIRWMRKWLWKVVKYSDFERNIENVSDCFSFSKESAQVPVGFIGLEMPCATNGA